MYLRTDTQLDESPIHWPFTHKGTILFGSVTTFVIGCFWLGFEICDNVNSCIDNAWPVSVWGELDDGEDDYCEISREHRFMTTHLNSISNLAFSLSGCVALGCGLADLVRAYTRGPAIHTRRNHILEFPMFSLLCGVSWWMLGLMSFSFHAHRTRLTWTLDVGRPS